LGDALSDSPVVLLNGARQSGKTTLVQALSQAGHPAPYITLDDAGFLSAARSDAAGFLSGLTGPVVIDEVQHAPELFPAIKLLVDQKRTPGRFLLTGSANVLLLPQLSESLAGRMEILTLWPLAQAHVATGSEFEESIFISFALLALALLLKFSTIAPHL
jgi:predicted AAA+ superfamily ATPase